MAVLSKKIIQAGCTFFLLMMTSPIIVSGENEDVWIDVRTVKEYRQGYLAGAANIPHTEIKQRISEVTEDKNASIYLYCVSGIRAEIAKSALQQLGYKNVINAGGLAQLQAKQQ